MKYRCVKASPVHHTSMTLGRLERLCGLIFRVHRIGTHGW
jgi:hypothetical protein